MTRNPYTPDEIMILIENINCLEDIQRLGDYVSENRDCYSLAEYGYFEKTLQIYTELFI